jgi:uncharacterized protein YodC (DUF2158 family)
MTIEAIQPDGSYACTWFDRSQQKSATFNAAVVIRVPREKPPIVNSRRR